MSIIIIFFPNLSALNKVEMDANLRIFPFLTIFPSTYLIINPKKAFLILYQYFFFVIIFRKRKERK